MPTGYTAAVADGRITTLRDFALHCARGMGALITMRDEPLDAPIPERLEPSTAHHDDKLAELRAELATISAMTNAECAEAQAASLVAAKERRARYAREKEEQRARYEAMISRVEAWTTEAEGLREFMLGQLTESLRFDCAGSYLPEIPDEVDPGEWRSQRLKSIAREIGYHEEQRAAEVARTESRNRWLGSLRDSLPAEAA